MNSFKLKKTAATLLLAICCSCVNKTGNTSSDTANRNDDINKLEHRIKTITDKAKGLVGVAVITPDNDTLAINNDNRYTLMSVFKLHEALAVAHTLDSLHHSIDSTLTIDIRQLDHKTWSPMLEVLPDTVCDITIRELLRYILQESDNNASNLLFDRMVSVAQTDRFIRQSAGIENFALKYKEENMQANHELSRENWSTPLDCAVLISKVINDSLVSPKHQRIIQEILFGCKTGEDRLCVALRNDPDAKIAHKTGSGYRDSQGLLMAHNDVGYVRLKDGRGYSIAVLVTAFDGTENEAAETIAEISKVVYACFNNP